jgi:hypothetical protein
MVSARGVWVEQFERSSCGRLSATVYATDFLYKLCGSSQPSIIRGSDKAFYVVKFDGFPGRQSLTNEVVGTELMRQMGLPTSDWAPIAISSEFIDAHPGLWFRTENAHLKPIAGIHFASRLIEAPDEQRTYQMIPHSWVDRIENRADFLGALVLDLWANNCDRRQSVFLTDDRDRLHARFIDNDSMFGGKFGNDTTCPRRAMVYDLGVYMGLWNDKIVQEWLQKIDGIGENAIRGIIASVPEEWTDEKMRLCILEQLKARRVMLPRFLNEVQEVFSSGYSVQYNKARHATEPSRLRNAPILAGPG